MKYSIEIECTGKCPFRSGDGRFMQSPKCHYRMTPLFQYPDCVGLGNKGCPFQEESCETCEHKYCCKQMLLSDTRSLVKITHCSAYRRAK